MVIGLSGAVLSFREELLDLLNPDVRIVEHREMVSLTPDQLLKKIQTTQSQTVEQLTLYADPALAARVIFTPPEGVKRGERRLIDPVTGALLPHLQGEAFFK